MTIAQCYALKFGAPGPRNLSSAYSVIVTEDYTPWEVLPREQEESF